MNPQTTEGNEALIAQVSQCASLAKVLNCTQDMLSLAEEGQWEKVAALELSRRDELNACFARQVPVQDAQLMAEAVAALLHLNEELMARLAKARTRSMEEGIAISRGRNAMGQYSAVQAGV